MSNLDQLVKGAPPPGTHYNLPPTSPIITPPADSTTSASVPDPLAALPSSPPQIYLNLLILEASLRAQWLQLRARRRQHTFFLTLLGGWVVYFTYALFLAPREDGSGVGGSVYWMVEVAEKVCLMGGVITGILVWATGQWERGVRWPRRWLGTTNRGLRVFNCKMVIIKKPWWRELFYILSYFSSHGIFPSSSGSFYRFVDHSISVEEEKPAAGGGKHLLPDIHEAVDRAGSMEDLAPGGDYVKLLLLPKPFSATFRENWDVYRNEYWERENERRAALLTKLKQREREIAKQEGGWLWWTGYRGYRKAKTSDVEKTHQHQVQRHGSEKDHRRLRGDSVRSSSHSRNSSRSTTPTAELEDSSLARRGSTASTASERRRKKTSSGPRVQKLTPGAPRSVAPEVHSPLVRENSFTSVSSLDSERSAPTGGGDADSVRSLRASARLGGSVARKPGSGRASRGVETA